MPKEPPPGSVVIVGASLAGLRCAETLRSLGHEGSITVVGDETGAPYDRPPLSKQVLAGEWEPARVLLRDEEELEALDVTWHRGTPAVVLDVGSRSVTLGSGEMVTGDAVVIATGARPRGLPGVAVPDGVFTLRTLDDALAIRDRLDNASRVVVVGAGFIGSEVAATCRSLGLGVTVLEALPVPMERALGPEMGAALGRLHEAHGVDVRCGTGVEGFEGDDGVTGVRTSDGSVVPADLVVVGIGVVPNTEWLAGSGLPLDDGVVCDECCTAAPGIYAAGDVARWENPRFGDVMRVEHWTNAAEMGMYVARRLLDAAAGMDTEPFAPVPFFWSDQYDLPIQFAGHTRPGDTVEIVHGDGTDHRFVALFAHGEDLTGVLGVSMPREVMGFRRMISRGATIHEARDSVADDTVGSETVRGGAT
ncbi:MAG: FAD-dependent oxidoreductase [Acidimicrobiia bacterium]